MSYCPTRWPWFHEPAGGVLGWRGQKTKKEGGRGKKIGGQEDKGMTPEVPGLQLERRKKRDEKRDDMRWYERSEEERYGERELGLLWKWGSCRTESARKGRGERERGEWPTQTPGAGTPQPRYCSAPNLVPTWERNEWRGGGRRNRIWEAPTVWCVARICYRDERARGFGAGLPSASAGPSSFCTHEVCHWPLHWLNLDPESTKGQLEPPNSTRSSSHSFPGAGTTPEMTSLSCWSVYFNQRNFKDRLTKLPMLASSSLLFLEIRSSHEKFESDAWRKKNEVGKK